jgi:hypothetical protein
LRMIFVSQTRGAVSGAFTDLTIASAQ